MAMLKAGADTTSGSNPDPRFALHTREGVGDASAVFLEANKQLSLNTAQTILEASGQVAGEVYKGYQKADLEKQLKSEAIDPFIARIGQTPLSASEKQAAIAEHGGMLTGFEGAKREFATQSGLFSPNPEDAKMSSADLVNSIAAQERGVITSSNKLKSALQQGQMTQQEFELRLRSITRSAINRNPGLSQELLAHAQLVEDQSGVRLIPDLQNKLDNAEAKKAAAQLKIKYQQLKDSGTPVDPQLYESDPFYAAERDRKAFDFLEDMQASKLAKQVSEMGKDMDTINVKQYHTTVVPKMTRGDYHEFVQMAHGAIPEGLTTEQDTSKFITQLKTAKDKTIFNFRDKLQKLGVPMADVDRHTNFMDKMITSTIDNIEADKSGKLVSDYLTITESSITTTQRIAAAKQYNLAELNVLSKVSAFMPDFMKFEEKRPLVAEAFYDMGADLLHGIINPNVVDGMTKKNIQSNKTDATSLLQIALESGDSKAQSSIISTVKQATIDLKSRHFNENLLGKVKAQQSIVEELGNPKYKDTIKLDEPTIVNATNITRDFLADAGKLFRREVEKLGPYSTVYTRIGKNGQMVVEATGVDHNKVVEFNQYAKAFNDGVKAMANIHSDSWQQSSQTLLNNIKGDWYLNDPGNPLLEVGGEVSVGKRGQNETNPGNIKVPGEDKFQKFESVEKGVVAIKNQLDLYRTGKSSAAGLGNRLITPEQMLAKYHNSQEKGSISQEQYLKNIATHSGMSVSQLQEPIEEGDKDSWVDLVYGIIKSESKNNITRKDVRQALNQ